MSLALGSNNGYIRRRRIPLWLVLSCDRVESPIIIPNFLAKREIKCLNVRIEDPDFERSVYDWTFLPDELIELRIPNFARAVRGGVDAAIFAGSGAIQSYDKADWLGVLTRS